MNREEIRAVFADYKAMLKKYYPNTTVETYIVLTGAQDWLEISAGFEEQEEINRDKTYLEDHLLANDGRF